ncbi:MAG: TonB-dependent receptor [Cytophagia bacterium]|nr:MAG: TonB-dependent receptor [Cytophagales bacterium]TAG37862.1 MAG: TonB-dependent receptor [Cytophagia bacterium]TAG65507.1 MAG: TonB-dependent receptor [Runella slithyformis]TAG79124.1 MAG: TonB-dependent receptor [Cytophagales bacterium]
MAGNNGTVKHDKQLGTKQKALRINLDTRIYGSFAEIGAGQDTAAQFFKAGGASGTIAKTMSAYDMTFSDEIYGSEPGGRYVVESRLVKMLKHEYDLCEMRLSEKRGDNTLFFAFANTVVALNYQKTNEAHGWIGLRFQLKPHSPYNEAIIHVKMLDNDSGLQQQALGVIGVNLMYGCFYYHKSPETLLISLLDDLGTDRMQIDMIRVQGPDFAHVDNRLMSLYLVKHNFTEVAMFAPNGNVLQPSDALYKKNILLLRGRLRPIANVHVDMLRTGLEQFKAESDVDSNKLVMVAELTLQNLRSGGESNINEKDFLDRVDILCSLGETVMISNYEEYHRLVAYLSKLTRLKIGLILGIPNLQYIFDEQYYLNLPGGILESFSTLFSRKVKLFVYPTLKEGKLYSCQNFELPDHLQPLFQYLIQNDKIEDIRDFNETHLHISTDRVLELIKRGEPGWEEQVPVEVAQMIKDRCLFGYPCVVFEAKQVKHIHEAVGNL